MPQLPLSTIAYARSGDKGSSSNIGVIAYTPSGYQFLIENLTTSKVVDFFQLVGLCQVIRYELPRLGALNFVLKGILDGAGSDSLRIDSQGKALGQALLEMELDIPKELIRNNLCH